MVFQIIHQSSDNSNINQKIFFFPSGKFSLYFQRITMDEDQLTLHFQNQQTEEREIYYLRCIIKSGRLEFEWCIEGNSKENTDWLNGHWFYIANHGIHVILPDGRHSYTGTHWIGTISIQNQIRLNTYDSYRVYKTYAHTNVKQSWFLHILIRLVYTMLKKDWNIQYI